MVQFTKFRITGFKSFVDATELPIEPGLTGVVGPNGCGKSNLLEALRWAMGEGSAKAMRGSEMDDVIFNGTTERTARNIAEVVISLDNSERSAPAKYNDAVEIEITRRIERGEGSNYRINGVDARARDVQLLFADLSTGARSTAIVSQGRVGALINAKPAQRRLLLEEAAGITGLYSRRHEAELRLRGAENNLARLDDVIIALEGQMQGLKRQARQAKRYRNIGGQIRSTEAVLLHLRWRSATTELDAAQGGLARTETEVADFAGQVSSGTAKQAQAAEALPELRQLEAAAAAQLQRLTLAREALDAEEAQIAEARAEYQTRLEQTERDIARERTLIDEARAAIVRLDEEAAVHAASDEVAGDEDDGAVSDEALAETESALVSLEGEFTRITETAAEAEVLRAGASERLESLCARRSRLEDRAQAIEEERGQLTASANAAPLDSTGETAAAEARLDEARQRSEAIEATAATARAKDTQARTTLMRAEETLAALRAEERGLIALTSNDEEIADPILGHVSVSKGYEAALGAALGEDLRASGDDSAPLHWRELASDGAAPKLPGGCTPLAEFVDAPNVLGRRLAQIGVVENSGAGPDLARQLVQGQRLVSKDGALWRWDGFTAAPGAANPAEGQLRQRGRLAEITGERATAEANAAACRQAAEASEREFKGTAQAENEAREALRSAMAVLGEARAAQAGAAKLAAERATRLTALDEAREGLAGDLAELSEELEGAEAALARAPDSAPARTERERQRVLVEDHRAKLLGLRQTRDRLKGEADALRKRITGMAEERTGWQARITNGETQIGQLEDRRADASSTLERLQTQPAEIEAKRVGLIDGLEAAEEKRNLAATHLGEAEAALSEIDKSLKVAEGALADAREERGRAQGAVAQGEQALAAVTERITERLACRPEDALAAGEVKDEENLPALDDIERKLERLIRERDNMGPVNLRAEQESEELEQQIDVMQTEREDLTGAIARFRKAITGLNREGRTRLLASFEKVDAHFRELFERLFGGGRAHLKLVESDDPLEAGLEIMAQPPGKRLQVMSLLSGGEQALTALALLFAVFMTNPAPICVLDEVDAPLDDANVDRFCNLLDDITQRTGTRFLLITHHRMTMARMDRLFGITMAERGVSQLVSVDLREAQRLRAIA
ncbi:MAG: chromosome segregation protein SMC [Alphaproteobacteria bacterium]|nr:chromosome segregation protein SMC [Alphaproteobacteria bacterium]